jgi:hypothetical protein
VWPSLWLEAQDLQPHLPPLTFLTDGQTLAFSPYHHHISGSLSGSRALWIEEWLTKLLSPCYTSVPVLYTW